jgi:phosphopantothenate-cysteine ligase
MLKLEPVPKLIHVIVENWAPHSFVVSFKLETDPDLLIPKSLTSLRFYKHNAVVANLLKNRKSEVMVVQGREQIRRLTVDPAVDEIERPLVEDLIRLHEAHLKQ